MRRLDVSSARRAASPRHRRVHLHRDPAEIPLLLLRLASVGLLIAVGWVHLHLWQAGYRQISTIGPLFLVAGVGTPILAVAMLARPSRFVGLVGLGTVMGILGGLIVSINVGLFGFTESLSSPFAVESIVLELVTAVTLTGWAAADLLMENRQTERAVRASFAALSVDDGAAHWSMDKLVPNSSRAAAGGNMKARSGNGGRCDL